MVDRKKRIKYIVDGAFIAAAYVGLTFLSNVFGLAYGPIQFRVSEVLTVLPVFTPAAIPGLAIGCFIANIASFNMLDMIFGTAATLVAAELTYILRNIRFKGVPFWALFPPVIINALVVGTEIAFFYTDGGATLLGFLAAAIEVGIGQLCVCYILGVPFYILVDKYKLFSGK